MSKVEQADTDRPVNPFILDEIRRMEAKAAQAAGLAAVAAFELGALIVLALLVLFGGCK